MANKRLGEPVPHFPTREVASSDPNIPRVEWEVSDETHREIQKIEENIRTAEHKIGALIVG